MQMGTPRLVPSSIIFIWTLSCVIWCWRNDGSEGNSSSNCKKRSQFSSREIGQSSTSITQDDLSLEQTTSVIYQNQDETLHYMIIYLLFLFEILPCMIAQCIKNIDLRFKIFHALFDVIFIVLGHVWQWFASLRQVLGLVPTKASSLSPVSCCRYCREKLFVHEAKAFCYVDGTMSLVENEVPT